MRRYRTMMCAAVIGMFFVLPIRAEAGGYKFTKIADIPNRTRDGLIDFARYPSLNNGGTVVFWSTTDAGGEGIYTGSGGPLTLIADTGGSFNHLGIPSINDAGTVSFVAGFDVDGTGIYAVGGGTAPTTVVDSSNSFLGFGWVAPINNAGKVAFVGFRDEDEVGIFTIKDGQLTTIADNQGNLSFPLSAWYPALNDSGTVAFRADKEGSGVQGIYTGSGGYLTLNKIIEVPDDHLLGVPSINNAGRVAWSMRDQVTGFGVVRTDLNIGDTTSALIADSNNQFAEFGDIVSINNAGIVAFMARLDDTGVRGIFTGPDPVKDKVMQMGDWLDGAIVFGLSISPRSLNDKGQVAFYAELSDGRRGIYRADPGKWTLVRDVTHLMRFAVSDFFYNRRTGRYEQRVTLTNISRQTIRGPIWLALDDLSPYVRLFNASGRLSPHSPYVEVAGREGLAPGASVSVLLEFINPSHRAISYRARVLAGSGER